MTIIEDYLRPRAPGKTKMPVPRLRSPAMGVAAAALSACATTTTQSNRDLTPGSGAVKVVPFEGTVNITGPGSNAEGSEQSHLFKGTGQLVKGQLRGGALPPAPAGAVATGPAVTLNFEGAELRDVVRNILADILNESYTIEPTVGG